MGKSPPPRLSEATPLATPFFLNLPPSLLAKQRWREGTDKD